MLSVLLSMAAVIVIGLLWRWHLGDIAANSMRQTLTRAVYEIFLPALVLHMLWQAPVDLNTLRVPAIAACCVLLALLAAWLLYRIAGRWLFAGVDANNRQATTGALLLAAAFGNFTYLGLPVLTQVFGESSAIIAIQFDLLACTPLLFTIGIVMAAYYGNQGQATLQTSVLQMFRVPALWAAVLGLLLSMLAVPAPDGLMRLLHLLGEAVIPLMLLAVGMALKWKQGWFARIPVFLPVLFLQLLMMPALAWGLSLWWQLPQNLLAPIVVEAGMPSMVLGLVICDRFNLDASVYAEAISLSTLFALFSLPFWLMLVMP